MNKPLSNPEGKLAKDARRAAKLACRIINGHGQDALRALATSFDDFHTFIS